MALDCSTPKSRLSVKTYRSEPPYKCLLRMSLSSQEVSCTLSQHIDCKPARPASGTILCVCQYVILVLPSQLRY